MPVLSINARSLTKFAQFHGALVTILTLITIALAGLLSMRMFAM